MTVNADHGLVGLNVHYFIWTGVQVNAWVYDPSASGAISSLDFSADVLIGNTNPPAFIAFVAQGGNYYFAEGVEESVSGWTNSARPGATQFNFGLLNTATGFWNFSLHPDFSASGAPITFGYALGTNNIGGPIPAGSDTISYDNIIYRIHNNAPDISPIPEPTSMLLVGTGLVGAAVRRRRQPRV